MSDVQTLNLSREDHVLIIEINRPPANAMNLAAFVALEKAMDEAEKARDVRAIILTGSGAKGFSAGMDLSDRTGGDVVTLKAQSVCNRIEAMSKPVIAAINGYALGGGCEIAISCHYRFMVDAEKAIIGLPETELGVMPVWGGTQRLPRLVGRSKATEMIILSQRIGAKQAHEIGLIDKVCSRETLMSEALEFANALAARPPLAVQAVMRSIHTGINQGIAAGLQQELDQVKILSGSKDAIEGKTAFFEKRKPVFTGE